MALPAPRPPTPPFSSNRIPRLTGRALTDLPIFTLLFGTLIGVAFPFALVAMGFQRDIAFRPVVFAACILAGLLVGLANVILVQIVVGDPLRALASGMTRAEVSVREARKMDEWPARDWFPHQLPTDSEDELGAAAIAFNRIIEYLAQSQLMTETAEAANRAKSDLLAAMSHELRTPLNAILGFSDLMQRDPTLSTDQRANLDIINRSGTHLLGLINQVLDMAKIEAGSTVLDNAPVDLSELVGDVDAMMRTRIEAAGLWFSVEVTDDAGRNVATFFTNLVKFFARGEVAVNVAQYIVCDAQKVRQIIINLLGNALKFTAEGGVSLRVRTVSDARASPGLRLEIEVEDSGVGISEDQQQRIFEPFVQLHKVGAPGAGLGLSIVREYLQLMGGDVSVTSRAGFGSLFRVSIPVEAARQAQVEAAEKRRRVVGLAPGQPRWRVLVVDDDPANRVLLQQLLEQVGFVVALAENGVESVTVFDEFRPHFIWMDRSMPMMDGLQATSQIRQLKGGREVKIAALTASAFEDQQQEWDDAGADAFIRKPFREAEIFDCMAIQLGVKYRYEERTEQPQAQPAVDLKSELSKLPESLRTQLADALVHGSGQRITAALSQVASISPETVDLLNRYLDKFDYAPVLEALEGVPPDGERCRREGSNSRDN